MKRLGMLAICLVMILASCQGETSEKSVSTQESGVEISTTGEVQPQPMYVMVRGELYQSTGRESELTARCGTPDGEIQSTVDTSEKPQKDDESNFGMGYEYQFTYVDTIEVCINQHWIVFEKENRK